MSDPTSTATAEVTTTGLDEPAVDHLMRMELAIAVDAPPDVVWTAIATGSGLSMWFLESEVEERVGGRVVFHMGPEMSSEGEVTAWEPPARMAYAEPDWVELAGRENTGQQPLVSEFLIEAASGGTSILRVVSSAYGTGADWEREWFADMVANWAPSFDTFARYVARHAGQPGARVSADIGAVGDAPSLWHRAIDLLGASSVGADVRIGEASGTVERYTDEPNVRELLIRVDAPAPGFGVMGAHDLGEGAAVLFLGGALFGPDAERHGAALQDSWRATFAPLADG